MNQLENTLTSLEVAEMVGKKHSELMKDIRRYIGYLNEGKIPPVDFFIESTYQDSKNETRPNFLLTKQGCEMVSNKLTGAKGVQFTAKYVSRFNQMEQHIKQQTSSLSPELQMFNQLFQASANVELEQKRQAEKITAVEKSVDNISEIVALSTSDWRKQSQTIIRKIAYKLGAGTAYQEIGKQIYQETERAARCSLKIRLTNMRKTMALEGASKSSRDKKNCLDVIDKDPKLVNIYMHTVKQFAIKYQVDVA